jgi:hypothetical protein
MDLDEMLMSKKTKYKSDFRATYYYSQRLMKSYNWEIDDAD